jgi:sigma-E factor negative regulatory protein RseC
VGDTVVLTLDESRLLKHSFMAYGLPLLGLFFLAWASSQIVQTLGGSAGMMDVASIVGGFFGLLVGWGVTRWFYQPVMPTLQSVLVQASNH